MNGVIARVITALPTCLAVHLSRVSKFRANSCDAVCLYYKYRMRGAEYHVLMHTLVRGHQVFYKRDNLQNIRPN